MSVEGPQIEQHSKKDLVDENPLIGYESDENSTFMLSKEYNVIKIAARGRGRPPSKLYKV